MTRLSKTIARQVKKLIEDLELVGAKSCVTPGIKPLPEQFVDDKPLSPDMHTHFRAIAARANYLSADRPDCQYAAKEVCRWMLAPTELSMAALKRLGRYLVGRPRLVFKYVFQTADTVDCYSDTDWAGCPKWRKSTSGAVSMIGRRCIMSSSQQQQVLALSSAEAETYGMVNRSADLMGLQACAIDLGGECRCRRKRRARHSDEARHRQGVARQDQEPMVAGGSCDAEARVREDRWLEEPHISHDEAPVGHTATEALWDR